MFQLPINAKIATVARAGLERGMIIYRRMRRLEAPSLKRGESISLRDFGTFYVCPEPDSWVFKFNPSQRLRKLFGWSSIYRDDL